jgi:hypothetical protein
MKKLAVFTYLLLFTSFSLLAQGAFDKGEIVNKLADIMNENYVFPEKGKAMHDLIKSNLEKGVYDNINTAEDFAERLDQDLKSVMPDKHIRVRFDAEFAVALQNRVPGGGRTPPEDFGFREVKILPGNIGYLDLRGFLDIRIAREAAKEAMEKLIQADAIIFDLRKNGGGSPSMIRYISAYLFGDEPVHLNDFYWRPSDSYSESWTRPDQASVHKPDVPVYVLTSDYTFSAAEEFTYNLKNLERATIIGETTGGGAHPGGPVAINDSFYVNVPQGRAINPITKTNWEAVGIAPHIQTPEEDALDKALELARKALAN